MSNVEKRTISLPIEQASYVDSLVAEGAYVSVSEVVRAGLRALQERDAAVERWLRAEIAPVCSAMEVDPSRGVPAQKVFERLRVRHASRLKAERAV